MWRERRVEAQNKKVERKGKVNREETPFGGRENGLSASREGERLEKAELSESLLLGLVMKRSWKPKSMAIFDLQTPAHKSYPCGRPGSEYTTKERSPSDTFCLEKTGSWCII
jgi:hypothetical protein